MTIEAPGDRTTGEALFLAALPVIEQVIAFLCRRNHLRADEVDEFSSHARLRLIENDYAILRKFQHRSSLRTFLSIVVQRLLLDYRTSQWGKWRPSADARRLGPVAIHLEQLLSRDGYPFEEACEMLIARDARLVTRAELERLAAALPPRMRRRFESEDALADRPADQAGPDAGAVLSAQEEEGASLARLMTALIHKLEAEDRLIMTLHFRDGRTVAEIAALMRREQKPLYRHLEKLLRSLKSELEANGVDGQSAVQLFTSRDLAFDWGESQDDGRENTPAGPSSEERWGRGH